jgi:hypothetical protein
VTHKVYFDVEIGGKPAGNITNLNPFFLVICYYQPVQFHSKDNLYAWILFPAHEIIGMAVKRILI